VSAVALVRLPSALRPYAGGAKELEIEGSTLREVLDGLGARFPALERRLRDETGTLRRYVNFYVGDDECRTSRGLDTAVPPGGEVMIIPAVAGGTA